MLKGQEYSCPFNMKGSGYNVTIYKYSTICSKFDFTNIFIE